MTYHMTFFHERETSQKPLTANFKNFPLFLGSHETTSGYGVQFGPPSPRNMLMKFSGSGKQTPNQPGICRTCPAEGISGERDCPARSGGGFGDLMQPAGTCMDIGEDRHGLFWQVCSKRRETVRTWKRESSELTKEKTFHHNDSQVWELVKFPSLEVLEIQLDKGLSKLVLNSVSTTLGAGAELKIS